MSLSTINGEKTVTLHFKQGLFDLFVYFNTFSSFQLILADKHVKKKKKFKNMMEFEQKTKLNNNNLKVLI